MPLPLLWTLTTATSLLLLAVATTRLLWSLHIVIGVIVAALSIAAIPVAITSNWPLAQAVASGVLSLWMALCGIRLVYGRLDKFFLRHSTRRAVLASVALTGLIYGIGLLNQWLPPIALLAAVLIGWAFTVQTLWALRHYKLRHVEPLPGLKDLPTVTLAIPARNETHALSQCLQAALASTYPKLEVLVLDDCSQDATSDLIRTFAHDGVRFVQGDQPSEGWLGKNNALRTLAEQASGDYIIFMDVDTHLSPNSITQLMAYTLSHKLAMVSVLAARRDSLHWGTLLWQLRYYWQVALPITKHRVPVASQCWIINSDELRRLGGFAAVRQKIVPEGYFARKLFATDAYRFITSDNDLGITTAKKWTSQNDTALRLLYPTFKRQPLYVLGALGLLGLILWPFVYLASLPWLADPGFGLAIVAAVAVVLYFASYGLVITKTNPRMWPLTLVCLPLSLVQEGVLLIASMLKYEFGVVDWKGRNVCYPVIADPKFVKRNQQSHGERPQTRTA